MGLLSPATTPSPTLLVLGVLLCSSFSPLAGRVTDAEGETDVEEEEMIPVGR